MQHFLQSLHLSQFRNLTKVSLTLSNGICVFFGQNGQGKTNILEAIAMLATTKSFRSLKNTQDLIQFQQAEASAMGTFLQNEQANHIRVHLTKEKKKLFFGDKPIRGVQKIHERISLVTFVPDDLSVISGSASHRRKLLNQVTHNLFPAYATLYRKYERALQQRNQLLKDFPINQAELNAYTQVLIDFGEQVISYRKKAFLAWKPLFQAAIGEIANNFSAEITYAHDADLLSKFIEKENDEKLRRVTLVGPHLDDLDIRLNNEPARFTASRGQCRALVLALKLAQIEAIKAHRIINPILLLDDVVGELDTHHATHLLNYIEASKSQTFITTTHLDLLPKKTNPTATYEVAAGQCRN